MIPVNENSYSMKKRIFPVVILSFIVFLMQGQKITTPEEAVSIALKNNFDILVSRVSADIDKTNNTPGNAGMLPKIGINVTDNYAWNNLHSVSSGNSINSSDAHSNSFNGNIGLNWDLFDGGKMFVTKKKLNEIEALGEIQFQDKVNQILYNVILAYYDVVRQKQQLASIKEVIRYNEERVKILQASFNSGLVPKTDLLQSQIDLNVYLENAILQETVISTSKRTLNQLLSRDSETQLEVVDSIELTYTPDRQDLFKKLFSANTQLLSFGKQVDIAKLSVKELVSQRFPWLTFNAGYNFLQSDNSVGTVLKNRSYGPQAGASLTLPLFYGGNIGRDIKIARLQQKSANYVFESIKIGINTQLQNALNDYDHALQLLKLEKSNALLAKENLNISMNRLRLGQTTSLEIRQAEESFVQSLTRKILFEYSAKVSETKLRLLVSAF